MSAAAVATRQAAAAAKVSSQPPALAALLDLAAAAHGPQPPRLIQTHISWIVLAGPCAYKLKKPLALGFLDYSTPVKRLEACYREVRLNRRLCHGIYLGVKPIPDPRREPEGSQRVLDFAVHMRRLPEDRMLDVLLRRGQATREMVEAVADKLAAFHAIAGTGPSVDQHGAPEAVSANVQENFTQTEPYIGRTIDQQSWRAIRGATLRFLEVNQRLFERRVAQGRIRDGHGDLHAASVCMTEPIAIFDCIEFNDRFRCGDVAAEVAFLAMDLEHNGRPDLGAVFVDRYVAASADRELRQLLDFYVCYRAYVRGKVESFKLDEGEFGLAERAEAQRRARRYFDLARASADRFSNRRPVLSALPLGA